MQPCERGYSRSCVRWARVALTIPVALLCALASPHSAHALVSFAKPAALSTLGNDGGQTIDYHPDAAGDGAGNWVAVFTHYDGPIFSSGDRNDVQVVRSSDDARTWTAPAAIDNNAASFETYDAAVDTDRAGTWVATWTRKGVGVVAARSTDDGATWSAPISLGPGVAVDDLATDRAGNWVIVWVSNDDLGGTIGTDLDLLVSTSDDNGLTWNGPIVVAADAGVDSFFDTNAQLVTDGSGSWALIWERAVLMQSGNDQLVTARSLDNGGSWSVPVLVAGPQSLERPDLAIGPDGKWIAVWARYTPGYDILFASSSDAGATWTTPEPLDPDIAASDDGVVETAPTIAVDDGGNWYVAWHNRGSGLTTISRTDEDLLLVRSVDGGVTWTRAAALETIAHRDSGRDRFPQLVHDGAGTWLALWESDDTLEGTLDTNVDIVLARSVDDCPPAPDAGCLAPVTSQGARIDIKDPLGAGDGLGWRWSRGQATSLEDFGDPTTTSAYAACLYDDVDGALRSVLELDAAAGAVCGSKPCWKANAKGFSYKDSSRRNGAIKTLGLRFGDDGKARIKLAARGASLGPPPLPLAASPSTILQLRNVESGKCWQAVYSNPQQSDADRFKARSD